jgi:hypothetical protein
MRQRRDGGNHRRNNKQYQSHQRDLLSVVLPIRSVALVEGVGRRGGRSDIRAIRHLYEFVVRNA